MRLSVFDRILLFLSMVFMLAIGVGVAMVCTSAISINELAGYVNDFMNPTGILIMIIVAAVIILIAVKLILALFIPAGDKHSNAGESTERIVLKNAEDGNIMVSTDLIKDIATRFAKTPDDVRDVDCKIVSKENGVDVLMKFYLKRDIVISEFLAKMQLDLKDYVEKHAGVNINSIDLCADVNSGSRR
ncbi:MAG: alkaline shock response membrane anchor protein AmaP [Clostridia bacterium]|nr:alkaline shock response membrane anchor protein AmaP [Clostridia bacterium]